MKVGKAINRIRKNTTLQTLSLGFIAGMRAAFPAAILSHYLSRKSNRSLRKSKLGFMTTPIAGGVTMALAGKEVVSDKLPSTPNRIKLPGLLFRLASGAFAGAVLAINKKESVVKGMLLGGTGAIASSYAFFYLRRYIDTFPNVNDKYVGAAEDLVAAGIGVAIMH